MTVTWFKIWRDLAHNKARTALVVLSIAVGVFAVGMVFGGYGMMNHCMAEDREAWIPIHVTFWGWFADRTAEDAVLREPSVADTKRLVDTVLRWRLEGETDWRDGILLAHEDYEARRFGLLELLEGRRPEGRALAVERMSWQHFDIPVGTTIVVEFGQYERRLQVEGVIRDPDVTFPPRFGGDAVFFATHDTATWLTGDGFNRIDVRFETLASEDEGVEAGEQIRDRLERMGVPVGGWWVRDPNEHWFQDQLDTFLLILGISGALSLGLSVFLIINTLNAIVAQQVWQIGVMKVVGATSGRVVRVYLAIALVYSGLALLLGVPLGAIGAYLLAEWALDIINVAAPPFRVMPSAVAIQAVVGLAVPLLAALVPALGGARITAHRAIGTYGLGGSYGRGRVDRLIGRVRRVPRPLALSVRNTFRRKARVLLTLTTLALGGAMFMAVMSVGTSFDGTLETLLKDFGDDATIWFGRSYRVERLLEVTERVSGVVKAEVWKRWGTRLKLDDGNECSVRLYGIPPDSGIVNLRVVSGRRLMPGDGNAMLLNHKIAKEEGIRVGDEVRLDLEDEETVWTVVGLVLNVDGGQMNCFVPFDALSRETGSLNRGWMMAVVSDKHDPESRQQLIRNLRDTYNAGHIEATYFWSASQEEESMREQFVLILNLLLGMGLLSALVGSIGLMSTMSINVVERRREIGVMRATGASSVSVAAVFVGEGVFLGILSWLFALPFSYPGGRLFSGLVGETLMRLPFDFTFSTGGVLLWLAIVIVLSALASLWPALRATGVSVREALAYE